MCCDRGDIPRYRSVVYKHVVIYFEELFFTRLLFKGDTEKNVKQLELDRIPAQRCWVVPAVRCCIHRRSNFRWEASSLFSSLFYFLKQQARLGCIKTFFPVSMNKSSTTKPINGSYTCVYVRVCACVFNACR